MAIRLFVQELRGEHLGNIELDQQDLVDELRAISAGMFGISLERCKLAIFRFCTGEPIVLDDGRDLLYYGLMDGNLVHIEHILDYEPDEEDRHYPGDTSSDDDYMSDEEGDAFVSGEDADDEL